MLSSWILLCLTALTPASTAPGPLWIADYGEALQQTKEQQKPLLVVLDNSADPAEQIDASWLKDADEGSSLREYELCHVDVSTEYGRRVAEVFRVTEFPHVAIIDKSGSIILSRIEGPIQANEWSSALARYKSGEKRAKSDYQVAKPIIGGASYSLSEANDSEPAQPYCAACQRK